MGDVARDFTAVVQWQILSRKQSVPSPLASHKSPSSLRAGGMQSCPCLSRSLQDLHDPDVGLLSDVASDTPEVAFAITDNWLLFQQYNITEDTISLFRKVRQCQYLQDAFKGTVCAVLLQRLFPD